MPVTLRFQSTGAVPGDGAPIVMRGPSLTIGRGPENDIVLPDPDRLISKNHCAIEDHGGNIIVIDFSTNGTFLNYGKTPLGRVPTPLNDGDVLSMGGYELVVGISSGKAADPWGSLPPPVAEGPVSHGRADLEPNLMDLLDDPGHRKTDFLDDLMGAAPPRGPSTVVREDPIDELGLPAIGGAEDPILGAIPDPLDDFAGASIGQHSPSVSDGFHAAPRKAGVIPDDWDDDFLNPNPPPKPAAPARPAPPPPRPAPAAVPDAFDSFLPEPPRPAPAPPPPAPRPAPAQTAAPVVPESDSPFATPATPAPPPRPAPAPVAAPAAPRPAPAASPAAAAPVTTDAARAFFVGAGADDIVITDAELAATMHRLGEVMKIMIEGLREILMTRASIKGEFRMERTQISAGGNNPLKFSLSPEHAVETILRPKAKGYLDGAAAVREALDDIKAHEVAMVTGMEAAIKDVLARLSPKAVEDRAGGGGGLSVLSNRKAKMWDEYEKLYASLAEQADQDFNEFFAKEFARAYQAQLERLK